MGREFQAERFYALSEGVELLMGPSLQSVFKVKFIRNRALVFCYTVLVVFVVFISYLMKVYDTIRRSK